MKKIVAIVLCIAVAVMLGVPALADELPEVEPPAADYIETPEGDTYEPETPVVSEPGIETEAPASSSEPLPEESSSDPAAAESSSEEADRAESTPEESEPLPEEPTPEEPAPTPDSNPVMLVFGLGAVGGLLVAMLLIRGM